ncbi:hydrogen peroxide-inducible genes activator [Ancylobacter sp. 6x-1]|uniref:Hydrogen peroxide-inducible genes activator n=1 Tax=Ancylobacter crimeensis TaxID=2579147 RepID=A0ABT0D661_9HYPH|nr:hydrogen peroxide-inducible genes activator [Ancylobacter crimeensis]MCK0195436.1 hydrogen peroxide-inducible genes activator [Ancylobacter crimeensis]
MLTLRQLRYLDALARTRHFGRAAEACAVTQPALSMQLRELEADLGVPLIERGRDGVRLTTAGRDVVERGRAILLAVADLHSSAAAHGRVLDGRFRLGIIPSIAPFLLPRLLPLARRRYGALELVLRESQTDVLMNELTDGELDAVIMSLPADHADCASVRLFSDAFLLAVPADAPLADGPARPEQLERDDLLLLEDGHCLRDQALKVCAHLDPRQLRSYGATSLTTIVQLVANGQGVTLLPELFLDAEGAVDPRVRVLRFAEPEPRREVGLVWRRAAPRSADIAALADLVRDCRSEA